MNAQIKGATHTDFSPHEPVGERNRYSEKLSRDAMESAHGGEDEREHNKDGKANHSDEVASGPRANPAPRDSFALRIPLPLTVTIRSALPKSTIRSNSAAHFFGRDSGGTNPLAR